MSERFTVAFEKPTLIAPPLPLKERVYRWVHKDRINSSEEVESLFRLPVLGYLPRIDEESLRLIRDISTFAPLMESYRSLRANLYFATMGHSLRSLTVTSSVPAEGKSSAVANLAMAMALDGKKVIIVDADLRRPCQHKLFQIDSSPGLTDVLTGGARLEACLRPTSVDNVRVLPYGAPPPNPTELVGSAAMGEVIATLEGAADIVLFDSPPSLVVVDSLVLASHTNATLVVVGCRETTKAHLSAALRQLHRAKADVLGVVLNRMVGPNQGYYYGKYYVPSSDEPAPIENLTKRRRRKK